MEYFIFAIVGAAGGFVRSLITGKGIVALPKVEEQNGQKYLNLGSLAPLLIGAFAGWLAGAYIGQGAVIAALAGYTGSDFIENLAERLIQRQQKPS